MKKPGQQSVETPAASSASAAKNATVFAILSAISLSHLLNDTIQSLLPAIYPMLKNSLSTSTSRRSV